MYVSKHFLMTEFILFLVNGNWGEWSQWGECSTSCNKGQRKRFRACDNPAPAGGGRDCSGPSQQTESCSMHLCPSKFCQFL